MKIAQYDVDGSPEVGLVGSDGSLLPLDLPAGMSGDAAVLALASGELAAHVADRPRRDMSTVTLAAPIRRPSTVRDFLLFEEHLANGLRPRGRDVPPAWYRRPYFYFTNPHTVMGSRSEVVAPVPGDLDYELELAAVVGRRLQDATPEEAAAAIVGFTFFNDLSLRDRQTDEHPVGLGPSKSKDFASLLGPFLVTPDEVPGGARRPQLELEARVNGETWSRGRTSDMYFDLGQAIAHASENSLVMPGDVVATGTLPTGCILELRALAGREERHWLQTGDRVDFVSPTLGCLTTLIT